MYGALRGLLFALDAERAHRLTLGALRTAHRLGLMQRLPAAAAAREPVELMGLTFANRIGLAAGFDKNATCVDALGALGFGFLEVGTVTPVPQAGNPRPRIERLPKAAAVINRMGFPNQGVEPVSARLRLRRYAGVCGVNIGKNAATPLEQAAQDYVSALRAVYEIADYVTINVSSPNTVGLRTLQEGLQLRPLLTDLLTARTELAATMGWQVPLLLKLSPDLTAEDLAATARVVQDLGIDGVVATNTTLDRSAVAGLRHAEAAGGLSGVPLRQRALEVVQQLRRLLGPRFPIIGVGGISSGADALAMFAAGADLIQIYTGLIYRGPALVRELLEADVRGAERHTAATIRHKSS